VSNDDWPPSSYRLMKSRFGERYKVMGMGQKMCEVKKPKRPIHAALRGCRKGMLALVLIMVVASPGKGQEICGTEDNGNAGERAAPTGCGCIRSCGDPVDPRFVPLWWILGLAVLVIALILMPKSRLVQACSLLGYIIHVTH
jgi:hypothetical protein